ncbi:MAG TPA: hypothetical protein VFB37_05290 [Steroidobacteraceae bacterium]|nr:hypothetical protein [Steroidobacteraceae bacterium]
MLSVRGTRPVPRWVVILSVLVLLIGILLAIAPVRHALLRGAGHALVKNDRIEPADVIVIAADARAVGALEAADLVREGISRRIALFFYEPDRADRELARRGAPTVDLNTLTLEQLHAMQVHAAIEVIPGSIAGTTDEGEILGRWCRERSIRTLLFVSTTDHSRRARRVLNRALADYGTRVIVHASRYSSFDPDSWWQSRDGRRTELTESEKLLLDLLRHPFS